MDLPLGVPVVSSSDYPDATVTVVDGPTGRVSILGTSPGGEIGVRVVRERLAEILAWLGPNAPDMRTGLEILADHRAITVVRDLPWTRITEPCLTLRVRDEGPCACCGRWTVRYRPAGEPSTAIACKPSHVPVTRIPTQGERDLKAERAAAAEALRQEICPRPNKRHWSYKGDARLALAELRVQRPWMPNTVHVYLCTCGSWHIGDRARTLNYKINVVRNVKKARARRQGR